jgi:hypothetical protein
MPAIIIGSVLLVGAATAAGFYALRHRGDDAVAQPAAATQPSRVPSASTIDLLARVKLPDDIVSGEWTFVSGSLHVAGPAPGRLRLGAPPPGNYDVRISFTPRVGTQGFGVILSRFGQNFVFFMGNPGGGHSFEHKKEKGKRPPASGPLLANDVRHTALIKVRQHTALGVVDGKIAAYCPNLENLDNVPASGIGKNSLGICTYRAADIHSIELTPVSDDDAITAPETVGD